MGKLEGFLTRETEAEETLATDEWKNPAKEREPEKDGSNSVFPHL